MVLRCAKSARESSAISLKCLLSPPPNPWEVGGGGGEGEMGVEGLRTADISDTESRSIIMISWFKWVNL